MRISKTVLSLACLACICVSSQLLAQTGPTQDQRLDQDIKYLASDELEGREPGTKGIELAAKYIIDSWKEFGVKPGGDDGTYRQNFDVAMGLIADRKVTKLSFGGAETIEAEMFTHYQPVMLGGDGEFKDAELVFVGYAINSEENNYNDFKDIDVEGKVVVAVRMEPQQKKADSVFDGVRNSTNASISRKLELAKDAGAVGFILVNDDVRVTEAQADELAQPSQFGTPENNIPFFHVKREVIDGMLAKANLQTPTGDKMADLASIESYIDENLEPMSQTIEGWNVSASVEFSNSSVVTSNVVGVVEGEGPNADETIVIGGHYDHLGYGGYGSNAPGRREVHNGADDNATGTAGILELARRFANADEKPGRRLVFIAFSGEERGLLGSAYYVNEPLFPLDKTVAMINYDMIGRLRDDKLTIFGTGSGDTFDAIVEAANDPQEPLSLDKRPSPFAGSDHMAFVRRDIPVMFLHTGLTNIYHTPEDDYSTLNIPGAVRVVNYTERLIRELADAETAPSFQQATNNRRRRVTPAYLGVRLDYEADERGPRIEEVPEGSPAGEAGLQAGDIIVSLNGEEIGDNDEMTAFLIENRPGDEVEVAYVRDNDEATLTFELGTTPRRRRAQPQSDRGNDSERGDNNKKGDDG